MLVTLPCDRCDVWVIERPQHQEASLPEGFPLFVHLPPALHECVQDQAAREGRTLAGVTRRALEQYLHRA